MSGGCLDRRRFLRRALAALGAAAALVLAPPLRRRGRRRGPLELDLRAADLYHPHDLAG